jgi:hypothetical protein
MPVPQELWEMSIETQMYSYFIQTRGKQQERSEKDKRSKSQMLTNQSLAAVVEAPRYRHSKPLGIRVTPMVQLPG